LAARAIPAALEPVLLEVAEGNGRTACFNHMRTAFLHARPMSEVPPSEHADKLRLICGKHGRDG